MRGNLPPKIETPCFQETSILSNRPRVYCLQLDITLHPCSKQVFMVRFSAVYSSGIFLGALGICSVIVTGCGGGGASSSGGGGTNPPPAGDFTIFASPTSLTLTSGGSQTVSVSVAQVNTYTTSVNISVSGLPTGVTASPATFSLTPGTQQAVTLSAAASVSIGTATITFLGTSGSLSHSAQASLSVIVPPVTGAHPPIRTRYLRTNSFYDVTNLQDAPPHFTVYDARHRQFFVSNPYMNEIDVFDAASETPKKAISVSLAGGIDISPTDGSLWAGTQLGDVYNIDTSTLSVIKRYPAATLGPNGFTATTALVLADGRLALQGTALGLLYVLGKGSAIVWNPQTNAVDTGTSVYGVICPYTGGGFALDGTRTLILMTTVNEGGGGVPLCSYDTVAKTEIDLTVPQSQPTDARQIVPTPDGKKFFLTTNLNGVEVFNPKTLQQLEQIPPTAASGDLPNLASGAVMSLDGKTLYLTSQLRDSIVGYDTSTYQQVSGVPSPVIDDFQRSMLGAAIDETGLIVGPIGHGVGFADAAAPKATTMAAGYLAFPTPNTGPVAGGTTFSDGFSVDATSSSTISKFYIGNAEISGTTIANATLTATTPAARNGMVVDLAALFANGAVGTSPESFSYGPTILEVVPNAATADGGQRGAVVGYGFGNSASAIQVSIGGQAASIQQLYNRAPFTPYPFPVETLTFTIPPGAQGKTDITVTVPSGSTTGTFTYTPKSVSYPLNASLQQGIYDARRGLYYFTDTSKIQVLSASSGSWLAPITLPGTTSASRLVGIAESSNGSMLAVADYGGQAIYVLNPDSPGSASRYAVPVNSHPGYSYSPLAVAVLDNKSVYYVASAPSAPEFLKLDLNTGQFKDFLISLPGTVDDYQHERVLVSPDQKRVYSTIGTIVFWLDTTTDTVHQNRAASTNAASQPDGAISADGSTLWIGGYITDASLNLETEPAYIDWETWLPATNYGQKFNTDGSILYQPLTDGVDVIERNTGHLLYRVQVPVTLANVYDPMLLGKAAGTLGFLTSNGVTLVDLSNLSIPSGASAPFPAANSGEAISRPAEEQTGLKPVPQTRPQRPALTRIGKASNQPGAWY